MQLTRRGLWAVPASAVLLASVAGCALAPRSDFTPVVGQAGKDVIWVPTPDDVVQRMLDLAEVKAGDRVVDLGSGDGKITIAAGRRGARARGIEFNPDMVALSRRNARTAGVDVSFAQGDIFQSDFTDADVVTLYLLPTLNERLRPILLNMRPGTRVTSHQFNMGDWEPDRTDSLSGRLAHLWIVPAKVAGTWALQVQDEGPVQVTFQQVYQKLTGDAVVRGSRVALDAPRLRGAALSFAIPAGGGAPMRFEATADNAGRMSGTVTLANGQRKRFTGSRA